MRKLFTEEIVRVSIDDFKQMPKLPLVMVLDNVRSLHNVGSVFRTADAYCLEKVMLCGITSTPPNAEIHKSALGAEYSMEWEYFQDTMDAIAQLKAEGYRIFAIEQAEGSVFLPDFTLEPDAKYAVVMGNEVKGVQQQVIDQCDGTIELPQFGTKHSLNVSVTAGIVIWDFWKLFSAEK